MSAPGETLKVVVCVRPPATDEHARPANSRLLGEFDVRAVEEAVRLSRRSGAGAGTTAVMHGSSDASAALLECLAMGVDRAIRVEPGEDPGDDGLVAAACLVKTIGRLSPDLVLCGQRSDAGMHAAVPAAIADALALPLVTSVVELEVRAGAGTARATQKLERGDRWTWECDLPMVCAVDREINAPRYLAVRRLARAQTSSIESLGSAGAAGIRADVERRFGTVVVEETGAPRIRPKKTKAPPATMSAADRMKFLRGGGRMPGAQEDDEPRRLTGEPREIARQIVQVLEQEELL